MIVARNIEALMEDRGIDAAKLARASGLNPTGVYDILKGKSRSPKIETIGKIAKGLGVPISVIFSENPKATPQDDLLWVFERLPSDKRALLIQAAKSWLPDSAA